MNLRLIIAFLCFSSLLFSQEKDSLIIDSIPQHSPKKAVIYSAILPGAGQIYNSINMEKGVKGKNKVYWKVPLIYAFLAYTGSSLIKNQITQHDLKTEYNNRYVNGSGSTNSKWEQFDSLGLVTQYTTFARKRDLSILTFGAVYLIQIIDAGIEAHFVKFDLSEDLTFQIKPKLYSFNSLGVGMSFYFHEKYSLPKYKF
jgi:hypothetical protein